MYDYSNVSGFYWSDSEPEAKKEWREKRAIVIGGSSGIGESIVRELSNWCDVSFTWYSDEERAKVVGDEYGATPIHYSLDVSSRGMSRQLDQAFDILVVSGANTEIVSFEDLLESQWQLMLKSNLTAPAMLTQKYLPHMLKERWGRVIYLSSVSGQQGGRFQMHYAAAKAGLDNLVKSLANEYGRSGVTFNTVSPGLVRTKLAASEINSEVGRRKLAHSSMGRPATPEEIAGIVNFLAGHEASYINGQTIVADGGVRPI